MTSRLTSAHTGVISAIQDDAEYELLSQPTRATQGSLGPTCENLAGTQENPQKLRQWKWGSIAVDILGILLVVPFIFLISFCASRHNKPVDSVELNRMNQGLWASATAFTLVFSALVSRMTRRIAEWRLERGSSLRTLETLNGSSTLINTVITQLRLRTFGGLSLTLGLLWTVSPVGSQSPLHILSTAPTVSITHQTIQHPQVNGSSVADGAADLLWYAPYIDALYTTSLIASESFRYSSMDPWANLKIPNFDALSSTANSTGWVTVPTDQNITYSALTGIPLGGLNKAGNVTAVVESTYFSLELVNTTGNLALNGDGVEANLTIAKDFIPWNSSDASAKETAYASFSPVNQAFKAVFKWSQRYFQLEVRCVVTGNSVRDRNCTVNAMKMSRPSTHPEFNWITAADIQGQWNSLLSGQNFSLSEAYLRNPQSPLDAKLSDHSTASPSMYNLRVRLEQLLNTIFFSTIDPEGSLQGIPSNPIKVNATRAFYNPGSIYVVDYIWLAVFLVATTVMAASAVVTAVLTSLSKNPDILGHLCWGWSEDSLDQTFGNSVWGC
ncbi:hypothetical protein N7507_005436 [Penicillium longicatenatum]|nr:hypothetical protein N7507_005436 [Penicillium longicatenatum]